MKNLNKLKKKELIDYITQIRPKADAYDRVCESLGIENNILEHINDLKIIPSDILRQYYLEFKIVTVNLDDCRKIIKQMRKLGFEDDGTIQNNGEVYWSFVKKNNNLVFIYRI